MGLGGYPPLGRFLRLEEADVLIWRIRPNSLDEARAVFALFRPQPFGAFKGVHTGEYASSFHAGKVIFGPSIGSNCRLPSQKRASVGSTTVKKSRASPPTRRIERHSRSRACRSCSRLFSYAAAALKRKSNKVAHDRRLSAHHGSPGAPTRALPERRADERPQHVSVR